MRKVKLIKTIWIFTPLFLPSCRPQDYHGWNKFTKYTSEVKTSLNSEFSKKLNCSHKDYHWKIKNLKNLSKIKFLDKAENKNSNYCEELWKFKATEKGKDSVILEYRNGSDIIVRNTIIVTVE